MNTEPLQPSVSVERVSVKVPPFNKGHPRLWFLQLESHFQTAGITQDGTKYYHVIASVDTEVLQQVVDLLEAPPQADKYEALKGRILEIFQLSNNQRLQKLVQECHLGDKKPSQLLREIKELAQGFSEDMIKTLWLSRLPQVAQTVLVASSEPLSSLAIIADKVCDVTSSSINSMDKTSASVSQMFETLEQQIHELTDEIHNMKIQEKPRPRYQHQNRWNKRICHYHKKFGPAARKCLKPCDFVSSKSKKGYLYFRNSCFSLAGSTVFALKQLF
uniref:DUF7041 domain-containing protein n=1 Tax=Cacopsylla melanoneura TaxID=428564 RepID=A0A8D8Y689_9HEMI